MFAGVGAAPAQPPPSYLNVGQVITSVKWGQQHWRKQRPVGVGSQGEVPQREEAPHPGLNTGCPYNCLRSLTVLQLGSPPENRVSLVW